MNELEARIAALPPEKRRLLEMRLRQEGLAARPSRGIPRRQGPGPYPLTYGQQRLWFIDRLAPGNPAYNIPFAGRLSGPLDAGFLERAVREMVRRHEVLRSRFPEEGGRPVQVVDPEPAVRVPVVDLAALSPELRQEAAEELITREPRRLFDLARGPLVRVTLARLGPADHWLAVTMAHIVTDAWSMALFFRELPALYEAFRRGEPSPLPAPAVQMVDYALWQRSPGRTAVLEEQLDFWRRQLAGAPTVLELPTDRSRPPAQSFRGRRLSVTFPPAVARALAELAESRGATSFMLYLAVLGVLLHRWSGQDDLLVGSPVATREEPETHGLIGFFINTAVLRLDLSGRPSFLAYLDRVREMCLATFAHQEVPFERLVEELGLPRDLSRQPLAQVQFVLQNVHIPAPDFEGIHLLHTQQTDVETSRFDFTLAMWEEEEDAVPFGALEYASDLFDPTTARRMLGHLMRLLEEIAAGPERTVDALPLLSPAERHELLVEGNDTTLPPPADETLHGRFAAVAARRPEAVALVAEEEGGSRHLSYGELGTRALGLARRLAAAGVATDVPVALYLESSPELLVGLLGTLAAGGGYLPLDTAYPRRRLAGMLAEARPRVLLTADGRSPSLTLPPEVTVLAPEGREEGSGTDADGSDGPGGRPALPAAHPESLAYVMYTSGSTGRPKGIAVPHRAVVRLVDGATFARLDPEQVFLQLAPTAFDASSFELWGSLLAGARLVLFPRRRPPLAVLGAALLRHRVTTLWLTAGLFHLLVEERPGDLGDLSQLLTGGDVVSPEHAERLLAAHPRLRLVDGYGPTEGTTFTCCQEVAAPLPPGRPIPIGRPIQRTRVVVVSPSLEPAPLGVFGELAIGGAGLARGYLARPGLTAERFAPDPFADELGQRLYLSGDRARRRPDGRLELAGRLDEQVKLRGHRVEPGEVAAALAEHPGVARAEVLVRDDLPAGRGLVAYVVPAGSDGETGGDNGRWTAALRAHLAARLPDAMLPAAFVTLESLPLTANGKVDRRALLALRGPTPGGPAPADGGEAPPLTPQQETLARIWQEVLGLARVGIHDDFFELGGDSILSIQAVSRAAEAGLHFEPRDLFAHPTLAGLAERAAAAPRVEAEQGPVTGPLTLTPVQRWFFELDLPAPHHWNLSLALELSRDQDRGALAAAVGDLLAHHDALRSRFEAGGGGGRGTLVPPGGALPFAAVELGALAPADRQTTARRLAADLQASLDLTRGPLLRALCLDPGPEEPRRLLLAAHHLVVDAVSWRILLEDLANAYRRRSAGQPVSLPAKTTSVQTWGERLRRWARTAEARSALPYWRRRSDRPPARRTADGPGGEDREGEAVRLEQVVEAEVTRALLTTAGEAYGTRPDELLLAALARVWRDQVAPGPLWLDREGHGREAPFGGVDLSRTVGWLTAIAPVLLDASGLEEPGELIKGIKEQLRRLPYRGLAWGALRYLGDGEVRRELARLPRPQLSFNYLGRLDAGLGEAAVDAAPFRLVPEPPGPGRDPRGERPHELEVDAFVLAGRLHLGWTHGPARHRTAAVQALAEAHRRAVVELVEHCRSPQAGAYTPSDFPQADVDQRQLDKLIHKIGGRSPQ